jgi:signal transduction histidine kinase
LRSVAHRGRHRLAHALKHALVHGVTHSIKGRLVALFLLLAVGTIGVFLAGMQRALHNGWEAYAMPLVADYADRLAAEIGSPPDVARARALTERLPITVRIDGPQVQYDSQPRRHGAPLHPQAESQGPDGTTATAPAGWGLARTTSDGHRIRFGFARPPDHLRPRLYGWFTLAGLLLLTAAAYSTVRHLLSPLDGIGRGVEAYGRGEFGKPIAVQRRDELGALAGRINGMAGNLKGMLDSQHALLLAISHELRSPLTRARVNAELIEEGDARTALLSDLGQMRDLISSLLESERLSAGLGGPVGNAGRSALHLEATDLADLAREVALEAFAGRPITLKLENTLGLVLVDATRMRLLVRNLLDNALRHTPEGAPPPELRLQREADGEIALGVRDHGAGLPQEQIAQLGQAFYRPDAARTRSAGGVGLGLYLCRLVAQAHGGTLRVRRAEPGLEVMAVWKPTVERPAATLATLALP